jgi:DNA-binding GntR family transcriptional regulator
MDADNRKFSSAEIYADVKTKLTTGRFLQGSKLRAERVRHTYNCSASTVREVFLKLSCEGHLEAIEQKGFRVPMGTPENRTDLIRMRLLLELEGVRLSLEKGGLDWEAELAASFHKLAHIENIILQTGKIVANMNLWNDAEYNFHKSLISACGSKLLLETHHNIYNRFRQQLINDDTNFGFDEHNVEEHRLIFEAVLTRDFKVTSDLLSSHIDKDLRHRSKLQLVAARV